MTTTNPTRTMTLGDFALTGGLGRYRAYLLVAAGALFVAVAAQVSFTPPQWYADIFGAIGLPIEGSPVPITLQTLAVGLTGAALGSRLGGMSLLLYMFAGIAGLPVYAGAVADILSGEVAFGATSGSLWGSATPFWAVPSFGYIIGFIIAASLIGRLAEKGWDRNILLTALALFVGSIAIYAFGLSVAPLLLRRHDLEPYPRVGPVAVHTRRHPQAPRRRRRIARRVGAHRT